MTGHGRAYTPLVGGRGATAATGREAERMNYRGKVAVVTGASSGIGYQAALALAERGCTVVGLSLRSI